MRYTLTSVYNDSRYFEFSRDVSVCLSYLIVFLLHWMSRTVVGHLPYKHVTKRHLPLSGEFPQADFLGNGASDNNNNTNNKNKTRQRKYLNEIAFPYVASIVGNSPERVGVLLRRVIALKFVPGGFIRDGNRVTHHITGTRYLNNSYYYCNNSRID